MLHQTEITLRWGELDALGHLNNVAFFRLMEEARIQWCHEVGIELSSHAQGIVVVNVSCDFLRQVHYPATIRIETTVEKLGRSSIDLRQQLYVIGKEEKPCATGHARCVWIDFKQGRSEALPDALRQHLQQYLVASDA
ncbi:MAG TPA: thioesterase family protein [Motiliproteus sp.]